MGTPEATAMIRADNRRLRGDLAKSRKMFGKTFTGIGKGIKGKLGGAFGGLGALGAGIGVAAIGKDVLDFEKTLTRLGIQAGTSGADLDKFREETIALSNATGISRGELIGASSALVNLTGSAGFAQDKLKVLAEANLATGSSMEDLAGLAFSLDSAFKLENADQLKDGLSAIITVGKEGAIPLNQLAPILQGVSKSFTELGGTGVEGATDLAASLQVLRTAFGGPAEAGTGLQSVITALTKKSGLLKKKGIKVFDKDGAFRGLRPILDDFAKANLTIKELTETLGRVEAQKGISALIDPEGRKELERLATAGGSVEGLLAVEKDAAKFRASSAGKLQASMNRLKETFAAVFTPERIEVFVRGMGKLADFAGFVVDHAQEFALIWASIKLAGFASQMMGISGTLGSMGTQAGAFQGKLAGAAGTASALTASLLAGYAAGTWLDERFGLSNKISDAAVDHFGPTKSFSENRELRGKARNVLGDQKVGPDSGSKDQLNNALRLLTSAEDSGVLSKETGKTSLSAARGATFSKGKTGGALGLLGKLNPAFAANDQGNRGDAAKLIEAIEAAKALVKEAGIQREKRIEVVLTVDQKGRLLANAQAASQGSE
jgi:hypothetical protein